MRRKMKNVDFMEDVFDQSSNESNKCVCPSASFSFALRLAIEISFFSPPKLMQSQGNIHETF